MRRFLLPLLLATIAGPAAAADPIVPSDAKLEKVFDGGLVLTEGVAVAPDGAVYFSDITFTHASKAEKNQVLAWMTTLDNFNNGLVGPAHCS